MTIKTSVIDDLKQIVGSGSVLTDAEDLYVYSFEHIFRGRQYPKLDVVVRIRSAEQAAKVMELADMEGLLVIRRGSVGTSKDFEMVNAGVIMLDDVAHPDLKVTEETREKGLVDEKVAKIHEAGHATFRNLALALETFFLRRPARRCLECTTCSGYCTVATYYNGAETWSSKGRFLLMRGLSWEELALSKKLIDILYTCCTCGLCFAQCAQDLQAHEAIVATRRHIAEKGLTPDVLNATAKNVLNTGDPSGMLLKRRLSWMREVLGLSLPKMARVLYWVGCTVATRTPNTAKAVANILSQAKVNFTTLREREGCCGYVLLVAGLWDEARESATKVVEAVKGTEAETLVTPCAGCYHTLTVLYPKMLDIQMPCEVLHTSQFAEMLIKDQALGFKELNARVTYHDPCSLGRHSNVYDPPRNVLRAVPNLRLIEMPLSRSLARCCGGGGGLWAFNTKVSMSCAFARLSNDVIPLGVETLVTACPACQINLRYTAMRKSIHLKVCDLMEIIDSVLLKSASR